MIRPTIQIAFSLLCSLAAHLSCTPDRESLKSAQQPAAAPVYKGIPFSKVSGNMPDGLILSEIRLDTVQTREGVYVLQLDFEIKATDNALHSLAREGFSGYFIDLKYTTAQGRSLRYRDEIFKPADKKKFFNSNRDGFITHASVRDLSLPLPFRLLELKPGPQEIQIDIEAFPVKFHDETASLDMKMLKSIADEPRGRLSIKATVPAPGLYKASLEVLKTKVNTEVVDPTKFDMAGIGHGYPDIFWAVYCGDDFIYNAPVEKNKIEYTQKYSSTPFYFTEKDQVHLEVADYDNGPFNTQSDIIGNWTFTSKDIKNDNTQTLKLDKLEYLVVHTKVEEVK